ncbi:unnamed protein product, partial [Leptidea sinapis]
RSIFGGTVGPNTVKSSTGETQQVYIGIKAKNQPPKSAPPAGPSSPILKAQLTNKVPEVKPVTPPQAQPSSHPHLSQALETNQSNTTLIKHLLAHKVSPAVQTQVAQRQQRVGTPGTVVVQTTTSSGMDVDPEALIKCTTITPGGIATTTEKINADNATSNSAPYYQIRNEQGQVIQIKSESGQIIQLKSDQLQGFVQYKNDQGHIVQTKNEQQVIQQPQSIQAQSTQAHNVQPFIVQPQNTQSQIQSVIQSTKKEREHRDTVAVDHSYTEPPNKKSKVEDKSENGSPQESVSKTAANLYAALAASALEDEDDLLPPPKQESMEVIQQPVMMPGADNAPVIIQEPILQPMDVQNIIASQAGQLILQGLSYITQNIPGNMMQKTIIIVQGPTGGGPLTLTNAPQITPSQQPMITTQPQPHKAQIMNQPQTQQIVVTQKQPPALVSTSSTNQMVGNQHIIQSNQQLMQGNQQIIAVSSNQQIIMNSSLKSGVHRIVQQTQRNQVATVSTSSSMPTLVDSKTPHTTAKTQPPIIRQVIRQPVMVGNTKIGEKETIVSQTITEDENEGPVTKSIRLTAALILRNIVIYSNTGRRIMRQYEAHLAAIALSNVEASRTIAQVLYDMNNIGESTYASRPYD